MRSLGKKLLVSLITTLFGLALLEIGSRVIYRAYTRQRFNRGEIAEHLLRGPDEITGTAGAGPVVAQTDAGAAAVPPTIVHPYFGYVANPEWRGVNRYGFLGPEPLMTRGPDRLVVGLFGGSVADHMFRLADDVVIKTLQDSPVFAGKQVQLIDLANAAYKQPQQLLVLATLLALGAQFDIVINLDGFNEIDAAKDNLQDGVNPFYPYMWKSYVDGLLDSGAAVHRANADAIRVRRAAIWRRFAHPVVEHSAFLLTLWDFLDRHEEAALRSETAALRQALNDRAGSPLATGPPLRVPDDVTIFRQSAELWERASREMATLCAGFGIRYFHFLQPNQYLPGSKVLTAEERRLAFDRNVADTQRVALGYPMLIERGRELSAEHIRFVDLTMLFKDDRRTVYSDTCCHLNERGSVVLAEAIAQAIIDDSDEGAPAPAE
jgi:hypothetical protein